jgi:small subunit ribosomal protein S2
MAVVTMRQLLDAGVHFGHQTRRWNPKMKRFILTERNGIYIIDLQQTLTYIDRAFEFVKETVAHGGTVLFVGTKRQAQEAIAEQATRVSMPYVNQRWLGGMLTNFTTVHKRLQRLKDLEAMEASGEFAGRTKKEVLLLTREKEKLARSLGGIRDMARVPSAIWVVDTKKEHIAVGEARKLNIPVVAVLDTNCDPDEVDYPLPGNDDAIRSAALLTKVVAEAVAEGLLARSGGAAVAAGEEPLAEWERELLEAGGEFETSQAGLATDYAEQHGTAVTAAPVAGLTDGGAEQAIEADAIAAAIADAPAVTDVTDATPVAVIAETEAGAEAAQQVAADAEEGVKAVVADQQESA